jgi:hypothetical protein
MTKQSQSLINCILPRCAKRGVISSFGLQQDHCADFISAVDWQKCSTEFKIAIFAGKPHLKHKADKFVRSGQSVAAKVNCCCLLF